MSDKETRRQGDNGTRGPDEAGPSDSSPGLLVSWSPRHLILGTAGHIDHGKTTLVRLLTGTDCDRLPAEQARGITIDLGFARLELGRHTLGVVDVPGHERFVRNMLAGATGIDLALLVVAADDGVMPQTREHLAILELLGVRHGVVALTKSDLVDAGRLADATAGVRELLTGTALSDAVIVPTAADGRGLPELTAALEAAAGGWRRSRPRCRSEWRSTGRLPSPATGPSSPAPWPAAPCGSATRSTGTTRQADTVRVRGLSVHGGLVEAVSAGQRAGVNLAGVPLDAVRRGQELAAPGSLMAGRGTDLPAARPGRRSGGPPPAAGAAAPGHGEVHGRGVGAGRRPHRPWRVGGRPVVHRRVGRRGLGAAVRAAGRGGGIDARRRRGAGADGRPAAAAARRPRRTGRTAAVARPGGPRGCGSVAIRADRRPADRPRPAGGAWGVRRRVWSRSAAPVPPGPAGRSGTARPRHPGRLAPRPAAGDGPRPRAVSGGRRQTGVCGRGGGVIDDY